MLRKWIVASIIAVQAFGMQSSRLLLQTRRTFNTTMTKTFVQNNYAPSAIRTFSTTIAPVQNPTSQPTNSFVRHCSTQAVSEDIAKYIVDLPGNVKISVPKRFIRTVDLSTEEFLLQQFKVFDPADDFTATWSEICIFQYQTFKLPHRTLSNYDLLHLIGGDRFLGQKSYSDPYISYDIVRYYNRKNTRVEVAIVVSNYGSVQLIYAFPEPSFPVEGTAIQQLEDFVRKNFKA